MMAALQNLNVRCYLRYQHCNIQHGDDVILSAISNGPYGTTVGVFQYDYGPGGNGQAYFRMIGTLDPRDAERINHIARPQLMGAFRPRGGPRVGSRFCPDIVEATVSQFSPVYNGYPPNYGRLPPAGGTTRPYLTLSVVCRI